MTNVTIGKPLLVPDWTLKAKIERWAKKHDYPLPVRQQYIPILARLQVLVQLYLACCYAAMRLCLSCSNQLCLEHTTVYRGL